MPSLSLYSLAVLPEPEIPFFLAIQTACLSVMERSNMPARKGIIC
jgi:hypothetical protein